jgi:hypothetical protein
MDKFLYQIEKKETEENIELNFFYVNEQKQTIYEKNTLEYTIYMKKNDFEALNIKSDKIIKTKSNN